MSFEKQHQRGLEERAPCDQETEVEHNKDNRDAYASASASRSSRDASSSEAGTHAFSSASSPTNTQSGPAGGSPAARGMDQRRTPQDESNSTFHRSMQLSLMEPVGSMSLSPGECFCEPW